jgi:hypothetical protein
LQNNYGGQDTARPLISASAGSSLAKTRRQNFEKNVSSRWQIFWKLKSEI